MNEASHGMSENPFNIELCQKVEKFIAVSVWKIYQICQTRILHFIILSLIIQKKYKCIEKENLQDV